MPAKKYDVPISQFDARRKQLYKAWKGMRQRCYNVNDRRYADWGGRGIIVCKRWRHSFAAFEADMGPHPGPGYSLDRKQNQLNYCKSNCRWATVKVQNRNKRHGARSGKLCMRDVIEIRTRLAAGEKGRIIAREYGVCEQMISHIKHGREWV